MNEFKREKKLIFFFYFLENKNICKERNLILLNLC
jgi:hypothetical protein